MENVGYYQNGILLTVQINDTIWSPIRSPLKPHNTRWIFAANTNREWLLGECMFALISLSYEVDLGFKCFEKHHTYCEKINILITDTKICFVIWPNVFSSSGSKLSCHCRVQENQSVSEPHLLNARVPH